MNMNFRTLIVAVSVWSTTLLMHGCGNSTPPSADDTSHSRSNLGGENTYPVSTNRATASASLSLNFIVPEHVSSILKRKCYICHGGAEKIEGGFDLKQMIYQPKPGSPWQPMDLDGVTRIKLAVLPLDGKPARMPKRAGSIWNPLSMEEANAVAKWTDFPYAR